ncbi:MAG: transcriptional regulator [Pirellulales bacterium]|nr:transcriptional regulator [Pirellulales bacterium]
MEVLIQLQGGLPQTTNSLARTLGVSRRTIFRDLELLRDAGVPLVFDDEHLRYDLTTAGILPPTSFNTSEALSLILLCQELGDTPGVPFCGPARSAALKVESTLPQRLRDHLREVTRAVSIKLAPANPLAGHHTTYEMLLAAIGQRRAVRLRYNSFAEQEVIATKVKSHRLVFSRRSWYLIGRSSLHRATRTFNLGRILDVEVLDERYAIPSRFNLERYLGNAWHLIPEPGPDHEIHVRFRPLVAGNVAEVLWHKTQRVEWHADGSLDYFATVSGLGEISWWILGYGDQAEVLAPAPLRRRVADAAERMAVQYRVVANGKHGAAAEPTTHREKLPAPRRTGKRQLARRARPSAAGKV